MPAGEFPVRHLVAALFLLLAAAAAVAGVLRVSEPLLVLAVVTALILALAWPGPARPSWRSRLVRTLAALLVLALGLGAPLWSARASTSAGEPVVLTDTALRDFTSDDVLGVPLGLSVGERLGYVATGTRIHQIDTASGAERWNTDTRQYAWVVAGGDLVDLNSSGTVSRTSVDGDLLWDRMFSDEGQDPRPVAADEEVVVVESCGDIDEDWATCRYEGVGHDGETVWTQTGRQLPVVADGARSTFVARHGAMDGRLPELVASRSPEPESEELQLLSPADGSLLQRIPRDRRAVRGDDPEHDDGQPALVGDLLLRPERRGGDCTLTAHQGDGVVWTAPVSCFAYGPSVGPDAPHLFRSTAGGEGGAVVTGDRLWLFTDGENRDADTVDLRTGESRRAGPVQDPTTSDDEPSAATPVPGSDLLVAVDGRQVVATGSADGAPRWQRPAPGEQVRRVWVQRDVVLLLSTPAPDQLFVPATRSQLLSVHDAGTGTLRAQLPVDPGMDRAVVPLWDGLLVADQPSEEDDVLTTRLLR